MNAYIGVKIFLLANPSSSLVGVDLRLTAHQADTYTKRLLISGRAGESLLVDKTLDFNIIHKLGFHS